MSYQVNLITYANPLVETNDVESITMLHLRKSKPEKKNKKKESSNTV